jgi:hypothetical protein
VIKNTSFSSSRDWFNTINNLDMGLHLCVLCSPQMKKSGLARDMARRNGGNAGDAADQMDRAVNRIVRTLRGGKPARLPGLGTITPGKHWTFKPERNDS